MAGPEANKTGLIHSIRRLARTGVAILENRLALFTLEWEEERIRLAEVVVLLVGAMFAAFLAIVLLTATVVYAVPEKARVYVLGGFTLLYLVVAVGGFIRLRNRLKQGPPPFPETLAQLRKDRSWLDD